MDIRPAVKNLGRHSYGTHAGYATEGVLDCALGRNSFGTSEKVIAAGKNYDWSHLWRHPDTTYKDLRQVICNFWSAYADLGVDNVRVANGSAVVLFRLNHVFIDPGFKVLGYVPQFPEYSYEVAMLDGKYESVLLSPEDGFKFNLDRLLEKMRSDDYGIIYIDHPSNPTGQLIALDAIEAILKEAAKQGSLVLVDEAYGDYMEEKCSAITLFNKYTNLVITRTFTKGYGVGEFRVGYAIMPAEIGRYYDEIELPFSVSVMADQLVREALRDRDFIHRVRQLVKDEKARMIKELKDRGYFIAETYECCPIFIVGSRDKDIDLVPYFLDNGIYTLSGTSFDNLSKNYVRFNTSPGAAELLARLPK